MENLDLYQLASQEAIEVHSCKMEGGSASTMLEGDCYIALDPCVREGSDIERMHLAHELGHCITGSFYNPYSELDIREKHEWRANAWAYRQVVPQDKLELCFRRGLTEPWQMEEVFDLPARFIRQAMEYYQNVRPMA